MNGKPEMEGGGVQKSRCRNLQEGLITNRKIPGRFINRGHPPFALCVENDGEINLSGLL
jgi:hypothetical protein